MSANTYINCATSSGRTILSPGPATPIRSTRLSLSLSRSLSLSLFTPPLQQSELHLSAKLFKQFHEIALAARVNSTWLTVRVARSQKLHCRHRAPSNCTTLQHPGGSMALTPPFPMGTTRNLKRNVELLLLLLTRKENVCSKYPLLDL